MPIIGKDISLLTQKASVAGTEKLPVSDTEYITPRQILSGVFGTEIDISGLSSSRRYITSSGVWRSITSTVAFCVLMPVTPGKQYNVVARPDEGTWVAYMASSSFGSNGSAADFASGVTGTTLIEAGESLLSTAPSDAVAYYLMTVSNEGNENAPTVYDVPDSSILGMIGDVETLLAAL